MIASTILAGCGSKEEGAANQVASEELKGDITFWHFFYTRTKTGSDTGNRGPVYER